MTQDEKARRAAHAAEVGKLRGEREVQLEEQANRKQVAAELRRRGEAEVTARVAADIKHQMEVGGLVRLKGWGRGDRARGAGWRWRARGGC